MSLETLIFLRLDTRVCDLGFARGAIVSWTVYKESLLADTVCVCEFLYILGHRVCMLSGEVSVCLPKRMTGETFDSCAPRVQRSCQVLDEPKVKCFRRPAPVNGYRFASIANRAAVMGPQSCVSAWKKSKIPPGYSYGLPKQKGM